MYKNDAELNIDRFYIVKLTQSLLGEVGVERCWGRRKTCGHLRLDWYDNIMLAQVSMDEIIKRKLHRGYELVEV